MTSASNSISEISYANQVLVDTQWLQDHKYDESIRIAEVDYDPRANYELGHIPGSVLIDWKNDINDPIRRNILTRAAFEDLLQSIGVNDDTKLVIYGDFNNWFAAFAFWVFKYYGFKNVVLLNGGRKKWLEEERPLTKDIPKLLRGNYIAGEPEAEQIRSYYSYVRETLGNKVLVDVGVQKNLRERFWLLQSIQPNTHKEEDIYQEQ